MPDGLIEIWHADPEGRFPADPRGEAAPADFRGFGRCPTDGTGEFRFVTVKPGPVPGRDGRLQAPHIDVAVLARGLLNHLVTRIYFPDEAAANATDPVLSSIGDPARRATLISRDTGEALRFDIRLQGEQETVFFAT